LTQGFIFYIVEKGKMDLKKFLSVGPFLLFFCLFLGSQSLSELAKKEKERRQKLKGKESVLITNATLAKLKKKPAILVSQPAVSEDTRRMIRPKRKRPSRKPSKAKIEEADKRESLSIESSLEKWKRAKEYVDLLTLRLNALWQEYYSLDEATSQEKVLREIDRVSRKLEKAREEEEKIKNDLKKLGKD